MQVHPEMPVVERRVERAVATVTHGVGDGHPEELRLGDRSVIEVEREETLAGADECTVHVIPQRALEKRGYGRRR